MLTHEPRTDIRARQPCVTNVQTLGEDVEGSNGAVFDLADVLHVGARHSLQSGLVGPLATSQTYSFAVLTPRSEGFASVHACMMHACV